MPDPRTIFNDDLNQCRKSGRAEAPVFKLFGYQAAVDARLHSWSQSGFARRLWAKDPTLWAAEKVPELSDRLGWLTLPVTMHDQLARIARFAGNVRDEGLKTVVLLGMGGSSLAPELFQMTFGNAAGFPRLIVLDSTHPGAVRNLEQSIDPSQTLFLVSSKSGTTQETLSFFYYFWERASAIAKDPGKHFVAITDPGTPLIHLAQERQFRETFEAPPDVGGRYAALTVFGLVPAALIGLDVHAILDRGLIQAEGTSTSTSESQSTALRLGAALGELALAGVDKVTFLASPALEAVPAWLEQLIAESTGKDGKGIFPVAGESSGSRTAYGDDRFFVYLRLDGDENEGLDRHAQEMESAGIPSIRIRLHEKADVGQEFFRWEFAVAAAGAVLGIHPFNQPDVQLAKDLARQAMQETGTSVQNAQAESDVLRMEDETTVRSAIRAWMEKAEPKDYVAIHAYLAPNAETTSALDKIRLALRDRTRLATSVGYGPRFLHSTGQIHKGGPNTGLFLQILDEPSTDAPVPETHYSFGAMIRAQAVGDARALTQRARRLLRVNLGRDTAKGLSQLCEAVRG